MTTYKIVDVTHRPWNTHPTSNAIVATVEDMNNPDNRYTIHVPRLIFKALSEAQINGMLAYVINRWHTKLTVGLPKEPEDQEALDKANAWIGNEYIV